MTSKPQQGRDTDRTKQSNDQGAAKDQDDTRMIRDANENIRKSQGDDAGYTPTIDRHR